MNSTNTNDNKNATQDNDEIRLQLFLSRYGEWSRRKAAYIIEAETVMVNGVRIKEPFYRVTSSDKITVNGKHIKPERALETWVLNKPIGCICSLDDPEGRDLAVSLIQGWKQKGLYNVGRLDYYSCGLLLLTNDGYLAEKVMHPSYEIQKEYLIQTTEVMDDEILKNFQKGFSINDINYKINKYKLINPNTVKLSLNEGKNREIRRFFSYHKIGIKLLQRTSIGSLTLGSLKTGESKLLTPKDIELIFSK